MEIQKKTGARDQRRVAAATEEKRTHIDKKWRNKNKKEEEEKTTPEREVKIILREFHLSTRRGVKSRGVRGKQSSLSFPSYARSLSFSLLLTLLSRLLLFLFSRYERPEGDALKPGCNPGDAIN